MDHPEDEEHIRSASQVARRGQKVGSPEAAKAMLGKLVDTFQKQLACDQQMALRFYRQAVSAVSLTPALQDCDQMSFVLALLQCAELGLMPGPTTGHAYIIPFGAKATLVPGYKGYVECAYRSKEIADIFASAVHEGDEFSWQEGTERWIHHRPQGDSDGRELTHAYVTVSLLRGKTPLFKVIDRAQALKAMGHSRSASSADSPWKKHAEAMWQKTAMRRLAPWLPMSYELRRMLDIEDRNERDDDDVKRAALGGGSFLPKETLAKEAPKEPSAPEEPKPLRAQAATPKVSKVKREREPAPVAEKPLPSNAPNLDAEPAPEDDPAHERAELVKDCALLAGQLERLGVENPLPEGVEAMSTKALKSLQKRLIAWKTAME